VSVGLHLARHIKHVTKHHKTDTLLLRRLAQEVELLCRIRDLSLSPEQAHSQGVL
jgi:hypothetical protein